MSSKGSIVAWGLCGVAIAASLINLIAGMRAMDPAVSALKTGGDLIWNLLIVEFGILAALIIQGQPGNRIGWLLMIPAVVAIPSALLNLAGATVPSTSPASLTPLIFVTVWYSGCSWVPPIFAILLLPLLFPTGYPPSPRWRWVLVYGLFLAGVFVFVATFIDAIQPLNGEGTWTLSSPVGFIPAEFINSELFMLLWSLNLVLLTAMSFASLVARYRGAPNRERQQIKLLVYACGLFAVIYIVGIPLNQEQYTLFNALWNLLFIAGIGAIPIVIAYSILRYRLFDIDLVIRRTLVYGIVTVALALLFYGLVLAMQRAFTTVSGQQSPVAIVASTLAIAALFTPLRRRVQVFVDRRFYRSKYDAQQVLARFMSVARDETDLDRLTVELGKAVEDAMRPASISINVSKT